MDCAKQNTHTHTINVNIQHSSSVTPWYLSSSTYFLSHWCCVGLSQLDYISLLIYLYIPSAYVFCYYVITLYISVI